MWQRVFQPSLRPKKEHDSDFQLKPGKRSVDLLKNEQNEPGATDLGYFIQNIISQRYPEALGYKEEIGKDVTKLLKQVMYEMKNC